MGKVILKDILEDGLILVVKFSNLTSETNLSENIKMFSIGQKSCGLILPPKSCALGHQVLLRLQFGSGSKKKPKEIEIVGKITEFTLTEDKQCEVQIELHQFVKEEWQSLLETLEKNQENIVSILKKLRSSVGDL